MAVAAVAAHNRQRTGNTPPLIPVLPYAETGCILIIPLPRPARCHLRSMVFVVCLSIALTYMNYRGLQVRALLLDWP